MKKLNLSNVTVSLKILCTYLIANNYFNTVIQFNVIFLFIAIGFNQGSGNTFDPTQKFNPLVSPALAALPESCQNIASQYPQYGAIGK